MKYYFISFQYGEDIGVSITNVINVFENILLMVDKDYLPIRSTESRISAVLRKLGVMPYKGVNIISYHEVSEQQYSDEGCF